MRSSAIFLAALVGVASAGMPAWPAKPSGTGGAGPTGKSHLGPGPVHYPKEGPTGKPHLAPGPVVFPSGSPEKYHDHVPSGSPEKYHPGEHPHKPSGSGSPEKYHKPGPTGTGTGHGGIPPPTTLPTTTITHTSDVSSKYLISHI